jgi:C-terminal processing protease CtpA/Prc
MQLQRYRVLSPEGWTEAMKVKLITVLILLAMLLGLAACDSENGRSENEEYLENFEVVWQTVNDRYFDPSFGGLDWDEVHDRYRPLLAAAESDEEFYRTIHEMLFELNVSHLAVFPTDELAPGSAEGSIGIDVRLLGDDIVITSVEPGSPGGEAGLQPGFVIQAIDGVSIEEIRSGAFLTPPIQRPWRELGHHVWHDAQPERTPRYDCLRLLSR